MKEEKIQTSPDQVIIENQRVHYQAAYTSEELLNHLNYTYTESPKNMKLSNFIVALNLQNLP